MSLFDLLFILLCLAAAATLVRILRALARGRPELAMRRARHLAIGAASYFGALLLVSLLAPRRYLAAAEDHCFDDWCVAVTTMTPSTTADGVDWRVTFRLTSRMGAASQRELGIVAYLEDTQGRRYAPTGPGAGPPFDVTLAPRAQAETTRQYRVPAGRSIVGVVVVHEGGPFDPRCCIIGDEESLLHRRPLVRLE